MIRMRARWPVVQVAKAAREKLVRRFADKIQSRAELVASHDDLIVLPLPDQIGAGFDEDAQVRGFRVSASGAPEVFHPWRTRKEGLTQGPQVNQCRPPGSSLTTRSISSIISVATRAHPQPCNDVRRNKIDQVMGNSAAL